MKKYFFILFIFLSCNAWAADCYISVSGSGTQDGSTAGNSFDWQNGQGLDDCEALVGAGDTVHIAAGTYSFTGTQITWSKSGTAGNPITIQGAGTQADDGDYGSSIKTTHKDTWSRIEGTEPIPYDTGTVGDGNNFLQLANGINYVTIKRFHFRNFETIIDADLYKNDFITVSDLYINNARNIFYVIADSSCDDGTSYVYSCTSNDGSNNWDIDRIYAVGVAKRLLRSEGLRDSAVNTVYVSACDEYLDCHFSDFAFYFHFDGSSKDITVTNSYVKYPIGDPENTSYDNGDCFVAEFDSQRITIDDAVCIGASDSAIDLKGGPHTVTNLRAIDIGNRCFRVWGKTTISNSICAYNATSDWSADASGSNACFWVGGIIDADDVTCLNTSSRTYIMDNQLDVFNYDGGNGTPPVVGEPLLRAAGNEMLVVGHTGDGTTGTIHVSPDYVTYSDNDTITTDGGFSALVDGSGVETCGIITVDDSIIAESTGYTTNTSATGVDECDAGTPADADETNVVRWDEDGVSGTDPQFGSHDENWTGLTNVMNSSLYTTTKGYYRSDADTTVDEYSAPVASGGGGSQTGTVTIIGGF